jgi:caa(3)-type oxidase subunit IV
MIMTGEYTHSKYVVVWYWLLGLALASVLVSALPVSHTLIVVLVFGAATVKALLVALYYIHLRFEPRLVYALALVPLVLFGVLLLVLLPEIASR